MSDRKASFPPLPPEQKKRAKGVSLEAVSERAETKPLKHAAARAVDYTSTLNRCSETLPCAQKDALAYPIFQAREKQNRAYLSGIVENAARGRLHDLVQALALKFGVGRDRRVQLGHVWGSREAGGGGRRGES